MKCKKGLVIGLVLFVNSYSALFWQTTRDGFSNGVCQIQSSKLRVVVHPFFVEVEEDAEISPVGTLWRGDDKTLEIVNEFYIRPATAIQSMLLWNGDKILKAKLKLKDDADKEYEDVVDRQKSIAVPRDPAIIEYVNDTYYRCRIYPVALNGSRKIRIRYVVPITFKKGVPQFDIGTIFSTAQYSQYGQVQLTVENADSLTGKCILQTNTIHKSIMYNSVYLLSSSEMSGSFAIIPDVSIWKGAWTNHVSSGPAAGYYSTVFMALPDTVEALISEQLNPSGVQLEVGITIGNKVYLADLMTEGLFALYCKSDSLWDGTLFWNGYNRKGDQVFTCRQILIPDTSGASVSMIPLLWAVKYTFQEKRGALGALFGFVDSKMSLLALESDTLTQEVTEMYRNSGVPELLPEEIIIHQKKLPQTPKESVIFESHSTNVIASLNKSLTMFKVTGNGLSLQIVLSGTGSNVTRVTMVDISGRIVQQWVADMTSGNMFSVKMNKRYSGTFLIRVQVGARVLQEKVVLP